MRSEWIYFQGLRPLPSFNLPLQNKYLIMSSNWIKQTKSQSANHRKIFGKDLTFFELAAAAEAYSSSLKKTKRLFKLSVSENIRWKQRNESIVSGLHCSHSSTNLIYWFMFLLYNKILELLQPINIYCNLQIDSKLESPTSQKALSI